MVKWNGKMKAVTFSYDDGVISDEKLLGIINKYHLKCTFNLNSGLIGKADSWKYKDFVATRPGVEHLKHLYAGHEIAIHGTRHIHPLNLSRKELTDEFKVDKQQLEEIFGTSMTGMAYAFGEYDDVLKNFLRENGVKYGRTTRSTHCFQRQEDLLAFNPTCHHNDEKIFDLIDNFLNSNLSEPQLFYIWGHSYEFDGDHNWEHLEEICKRLSGHDDVFYGTNQEVLL
ncbi:MAG: polysaccharide deacetylase family protein [Oscillospiraceae bacterium]